MSIKVTINGLKTKKLYGEVIKGKVRIRREVTKIEDLKAEVEKVRKEHGLEKVGEVTVSWDDNKPENDIRGEGNGGVLGK